MEKKRGSPGGGGGGVLTLGGVMRGTNAQYKGGGNPDAYCRALVLTGQRRVHQCSVPDRRKQ